MDSNELPLAVVGAGAVGSIVIGRLIGAGYENLAVVDVPKRIDQIREHGIGLSNLADIHVTPKHLFPDVRELKGRGVKTLIVCTKVTHLARLCPALKEIHQPDMIVVSFQNGIGTENYIGQYIDPMMVARAIVNFAGVRDDRTGHVAISWFHPPNFIGPWQPQAGEPFEEIASLLTEVGLETRAVERIEMKRQAFYKTILNAALNAMCATTGLTMAEAMSMKQTRFLARQLIREGLSVATQMGYHYGEDVLERSISYLDMGGNHYPSMWVDLQKNRRTEIDFINGKLVKIGMMYGAVDVSLNMFFSTMVMTREIKSGVRTEAEIPPYLGCNVRLCY